MYNTDKATRPNSTDRGLPDVFVSFRTSLRVVVADKGLPIAIDGAWCSIESHKPVSNVRAFIVLKVSRVYSSYNSSTRDFESDLLVHPDMIASATPLVPQ